MTVARDRPVGTPEVLVIADAAAYRPIMRRVGSVLAAVGRFAGWLALGPKRFPPPGVRTPRELAERQAEEFNLAGLRIRGPFGG